MCPNISIFTLVFYLTVRRCLTLRRLVRSLRNCREKFERWEETSEQTRATIIFCVHRDRDFHSTMISRSSDVIVSWEYNKDCRIRFLDRRDFARDYDFYPGISRITFSSSPAYNISPYLFNYKKIISRSATEMSRCVNNCCETVRRRKVIFQLERQRERTDWEGHLLNEQFLVFMDAEYSSTSSPPSLFYDKTVFSVS